MHNKHKQNLQNTSQKTADFKLFKLLNKISHKHWSILDAIAHGKTQWDHASIVFVWLQKGVQTIPTRAYSFTCKLHHMKVTHSVRVFCTKSARCFDKSKCSFLKVFNSFKIIGQVTGLAR